MTRRKVCVVVTARPSYSRIKSALHAIDSHPHLELQLVAAASALLENYGRVVNTMEQDGFEVRERVFSIIEGENLVTSAKSTGLALVELATVFDHLEPDVVITIADRFETIATSIAAAYMNIPLAHIQGSEITGSIDEKVRHANTKFADTHFVSTPKAAERVIRMGENPQNVHVTGCPSIDLAKQVFDEPHLNFDPFAKYGGVGEEFDYQHGYLVVMQHPVTTEYDCARWQVTQTLIAIKELGIPTFWFWPNVDAGSDGTSQGIRAFRENEHPENIRFFKNMLPEDFLRLIHNSRAIVGNSSVAIRECSFLGVPAVNIGSREQGRERGINVIDVEHDSHAITAALQQHLANGRYASDHLYGDGMAGKRIADLLATQPLAFEKRLMY